jgi:plasmid stability protein
MATTMTIRNMDDPIKIRLRVQAALHGRSMKDEAHDIDILQTTLPTEPAPGASLVDAIRARVTPLGDVELELPVREAIRAPRELA